MTYAPEQSAANHIFTQRYQCMIPRSFMFGPEYARKVGYGVTGNQIVDRMQVNSLETQHQTIAGLAVLYHQGAEPLLVNEADCVPIYKALVKHLTDWRDFTAQGVNPAYCPPVIDFIVLDKLAEYYHYRAVELSPAPETTDRLHNAIMALNRSGNRAVVRQKSHNDDNTIRAYVSIADDIERNLYED